MHPEDAKEIAKGTKTVGYHEWVDIPNGLVYQSCCDCGLSHAIMVALPDLSAIPEETLRVRFIYEPDLTDATREQEKLSIPLYREVKLLREERKVLQGKIQAALTWIKEHGEPHYHSDVEEILNGVRDSR